ncbi:MAG: hypothetical protein IKD68_14805, partial [Solobacterium sp.]|nr:hypothetical protein [Solobacterium sp.]
MRVTGWEDQETSVVHKPGSPITIDKDMSFAAVGDKVYRVRFDDTQLGYMSAEQSDGDLIGAAKGETVRFTVTPVDGYRVSKVSYTVCEGEYPLIGFDPVEIIPADDTYQLTMPDLQSVDLLANTVLISAEFEAIPSYTITCETCANGTVSTGEVTTA